MKASEATMNRLCRYATNISSRCKDCGYRVRGENHENGAHHKTKVRSDGESRSAKA